MNTWYVQLCSKILLLNNGMMPETFMHKKKKKKIILAFIWYYDSEEGDSKHRCDMKQRSGLDTHMATCSYSHAKHDKCYTNA